MEHRRIGPEPQVSPRPSQGAVPVTGGKLVLVVDDSPDERAIQGAMLRHAGYQVEEAADGRTAVELARQNQPALVLLDVAMPRMDGFAVCRALREDARTADVRIVLYTASVVREVKERALEAGADDVLMKPVDPKVVAEKIRSMIGPPLPTDAPHPE